jgi:hypothetical protein
MLQALMYVVPGAGLEPATRSLLGPSAFQQITGGHGEPRFLREMELARHIPQFVYKLDALCSLFAESDQGQARRGQAPSRANRVTNKPT